jgi:transcriptional regulator with XRE-family HTH domain
MTKSLFSNDYETLRALLQGARKEAGLTQAELSKNLSRPQSFVSKYERGERRLDVIEFLEVTQSLGIDPAEVLKSLTKSRPAKRKAKVT